jgi:hypothetical protein
MEIVSDVQCFSYTELPTRGLIGPESHDSDGMTGNPSVIGFGKVRVADHPGVTSAGPTKCQSRDQEDRQSPDCRLLRQLAIRRIRSPLKFD